MMVICPGSVEEHPKITSKSLLLLLLLLFLLLLLLLVTSITPDKAPAKVSSRREQVETAQTRF